MRQPEEMMDSTFLGEKRENEIPHGLAHVLWFLVAFVQKVITRYTVHDRNRVLDLQSSSGAVIACTHHSFLDVSFIWCSLGLGHYPRMMARDTLFRKNALISQIMARCGAFPVTRDSADRTSVKRAVKMLKNKEIVCIFPEGTRRGKTTFPPTLHAGAALIARMGKSPLVPACARNAEKVKEEGKFLRCPHVDVYFGNPVYPKDFDFLPKEDRLQGCIWYTMRESFALQEGCKPQEVDMAALFPDSKDFAEVFAQREEEVKHAG